MEDELEQLHGKHFYDFQYSVTGQDKTRPKKYKHEPSCKIYVIRYMREMERFTIKSKKKFERSTMNSSNALLLRRYLQKITSESTMNKLKLVERREKTGALSNH